MTRLFDVRRGRQMSGPGSAGGSSPGRRPVVRMLLGDLGFEIATDPGGLRR
ncbi:hypothetical protein FHR32_000671 [Streptosporangium album]|uniref:Uncharacterized protein n=1 Tax=Streptosporangium album TaxID=47479 RepID=A0A7W7RQL0_9ACTN|nr:hypothetical protein [Streptosporangium album]MBB4936366.1 hypothetical protein [Streptosporangium album]